MVESEWVRPANRADGAHVQLLLMGEGLESEFVPSEFVVCEIEGRIVGCARAKKLPEGGTELSSLVVHQDHRGRGMARSMVTMVLLGARHPVYALTLVPEMASRAGFEPIPSHELPPSLQSKASACTTSGRPWAAMRLRRVEARLPPVKRDADPNFLGG